MRRQLCALCVAVLVIGTARSAVADDKQQAKQLFESGLKLMHLDDFAGASADFERSVALYPTQNSLFNLANCYKALQRYGEALDVLARSRRQFGDKLKPEIKEAMDRQEREIQSLGARLTIRTVPADALVKIDGRTLGTGPALGPVMLGPGDHQIEASRVGYQERRRSLQLVSGAEVTETFNLVAEFGQVAARANPDGASVPVGSKEDGKIPLASAPVGPAIVPTLVDHMPAAPPVPGVLGLATAVPPEHPAQPRSHTGKIIMWSSLSGAVVAGIVAGVYWKLADDEFQTYKALNTKVQTDPNATPSRNASGDRVTRDKWIAIGCGIGAGALAVTALVTYLIDRSDRDAKHAGISLSAAGLNVSF